MRQIASHANALHGFATVGYGGHQGHCLFGLWAKSCVNLFMRYLDKSSWRI